MWNSKWFIIIDAKSKFPIVVDMYNDTSAVRVCNALDQIFDWLGPPETLVSDNGPPFNSYGINHLTIAPYHPAGNGLAERFVRTFKEAMLKEQTMGTLTKEIALRQFLRIYRWTPHSTTGSSPANLMFQHSIRTQLDMIRPIQEKTKTTLSKFTIGQPVWVLNHTRNDQTKWREAIIMKHLK